MWYVEISCEELLYFISSCSQTEHLYIVILLVFSFVVKVLVGIVILLYKDCHLMFYRVKIRISTKLLRELTVLFWFIFIINYINFAISLFIEGSDVMFDYIFLIMSVPFMSYNFFRNKIIIMYWRNFIKVTETNIFFIYYFYIIKATILLVFLLFTVSYDYWLPYVLLPLVPFGYYFYTKNFKLLLNMSTTRLCRTLLAMILLETDITRLVDSIPTLYQTNNLIIATFMAFELILAVLIRVSLFLYKDWDWDFIFSRVSDKIGEYLVVIIITVFWLGLLFHYTNAVLIILTLGFDNPLDYPLFIMWTLWVYDSIKHVMAIWSELRKYEWY